MAKNSKGCSDTRHFEPYRSRRGDEDDMENLLDLSAKFRPAELKQSIVAFGPQPAAFCKAEKKHENDAAIWLGLKRDHEGVKRR